MRKQNACLFHAYRVLGRKGQQNQENNNVKLSIRRVKRKF